MFLSKFSRECSSVIKKAVKSTINDLLYKDRMTIEEAKNILEIKEDRENSKEMIDKKYNYLFDINAKKNKGSYYIQSIIKDAYELFKEKSKYYK